MDVLDKIQILPFEGSYESRMVYEKAHLQLAMEYIDGKKYKKAIETLKKSMEWPENIGVGKPYDPDERKQEFLLAYCYQQLNRATDASQELNQVIAYTKESQGRFEPEQLLGVEALKLTGDKDQAIALYDQILSSESLGEKWKTWLQDHYHPENNPVFAGDFNNTGSEEMGQVIQMIRLFEK